MNTPSKAPQTTVDASGAKKHRIRKKLYTGEIGFREDGSDACGNGLVHSAARYEGREMRDNNGEELPSAFEAIVVFIRDTNNRLHTLEVIMDDDNHPFRAYDRVIVGDNYVSLLEAGPDHGCGCEAVEPQH